MLRFIIIYLITIIIAGIIAAVFHKRKGTLASAVLSTSAAACILFMYTVINFSCFTIENINVSWSMPLADIELGLDYLSLFLLIPLLILAAATSLYGLKYFGKKSHGRMHWLNFSLLTAGMIMVLISRNVLLFMISWEIMSFSSFLLVISDAEKDSIRRAGWIYLITAHLGTAFLLTAFFLLSTGTESLSFTVFGGQVLSSARENLILIFAVAGFGLKAGFIPFHIWLPLAHPAAPSHVSALMSGIMIKMGVYGILRVLTFLSIPHLWWAFLFLAIGAASGIIGVLFAIGQHDLKRLLAYHSVENIGIIMLGIGLGILGSATGNPAISTFGYAGALLHILNHALFKGLLFLGAGAVIRQSGTGEIDQLGGLLKKMPLTGSLFLTGSIAITGLPVFNGFISEIFIYTAAVSGALVHGETLIPLISALTVLSLALIGGLAAACFTKVFGIIFQGLPRGGPTTKNIGEVPALMCSGMLVLAVFLFIIGVLSFLVVPFLEGPLLMLTAGASVDYTDSLLAITRSLSWILPIMLGVIFLLMAAGNPGFRKKSLRRTETWGCGYTRPEPSMQYTASSYAEPITEWFSILIASKRECKGGRELFPVKVWNFSSHSNDWFLSGIFIRLAGVLDRLLSLLRWFQCGKAGVYVFYIATTVLILFIWKFIV